MKNLKYKLHWEVRENINGNKAAEIRRKCRRHIYLKVYWSVLINIMREFDNEKS